MGEKHDQVDRYCRICASPRNLSRGHVARAASSAGRHDTQVRYYGYRHYGYRHYGYRHYGYRHYGYRHYGYGGYYGYRPFYRRHWRY